jgi:NAD(P)-dependent dehydrogenase (short-subunit alcohol dehydrogenase family)
MHQHKEQVSSARRAGRGLEALRAALGIDVFSFAGKVVLITGGSRGLGLVMARRLVAEGAKVAILARNEEELGKAEEDLRRRGAEALAIVCDVRDKEQSEAAVREVATRLGPVDVLINNAGTITVGPMELMTPEDYDDAMRTHFWGPLHMTLAVLPDMRRRGRGRIVNISSIGGKVPAPHMLPYVASKFALVGLSEGMRVELLKEGIVVTTVCPGFMRTGSPYNCLFKGKNRMECAWFTLMDSLPLISMSAERAARQILRSVRFGRAEVTIGVLARLLAKRSGLFPGLSADMMGLVGRFLPRPGGIGTRRAKGRDSQSPATRSILAILTRKAAIENNEL